jgi:ketosteroid isomerase-like protein
MSENLDLVRSIVADWERGDWSSVKWADPDIELEFAGVPGGRHVGLDGMAEGVRDWMRVWKDFRVAEVEEYRELDDERVLVLHRFIARGKSSGLTVEHMQPKGASLFHMRDGTVTRLVAYPERDRALADLGLEE